MSMEERIGAGLARWLRGSARGITTRWGFSAGITILISTVELIPQSVAEAELPRSLATAAVGAAAVASLHELFAMAQQTGKVHLLAAAAAASTAVYALPSLALPR
jgi:zinc transporter ZupT